MKKITVFAFFILASLGLHAQGVKVHEYSANGSPSFISFDAKTFRSAYSAPEALLKEQLKPAAEVSFQLEKAEADEMGMIHHKYQQFYKGIKVEFAQYTVHTEGAVARAMNGDFANLHNFGTSPSLSESAALGKALSFVNAKAYKWQTEPGAYSLPKGELVIVPNFYPTDKRKDMEPTLAYKFDVYAENPVSRGHIYIDAKTGQLVAYNPIIKHAVATGTAATRYSGTKTITTDSYNATHRLRDYSRGNGVETYNMRTGTSYTSAVDFTDTDNSWTEYANTAKDNAALDAHWGAQMTYDYFKLKHNRNSFDNAGAIIKSYVHYDVAYDNAYWDGTRMTYGDGSGTYFDALTSLDVAGHEIGHAVCEKTAGLVYQKESGAMNEGFSDIWGACIEYFAAPTKQTWLIGEDIERRAGHASLRSMSNPNAEAQPDTYGGTYWKPVNCTPSQSNDYCGVHTNSGVLNYWFYLLSIGGSGTNDISNAFSVTGIGIDKAAQIAYRTESVYLSANSTFANARTYAIQSATELFGAGSAEVIATTNAWYAVGVGAAYSGGGTTCGTPSGLASSSVATTSFTLSWTAVSGATSYDVNVGGVITNTTATTLNVTGKTAATTYATSVRANCAGGSSAYSANVNVTTLAAGCANTNIAFNLTFDQYPAETNWTLKNAAGTTVASGNGYTAANATIALNWCLADGTYTFAIVDTYGDGICCTYGNGNYNIKNGTTTLASGTGSYGAGESKTFTVGTVTPPSCGVPTGLASSSVASTSFTLTWAAVSGAVSYDVNVGGVVTNTTATTLNVTGKTASTTYACSVRANCSGATSAYGTAVSVTTTAASTTPSPVCTTLGTAVSVSKGTWKYYTVTVPAGTASWTITTTGTNGDVDLYIRQGTTNPTTSTYTARSWATGSNETITRTAPGSGTWKVGVYGYAAATGVTIKSCTTATALAGLVQEGGEEKELPFFSIYPNPAHDVLNVTTANMTDVSVHIYNMSGQLVRQLSISDSNGAINIADLRTGVYILKLVNAEGTFTERFVKE